MRVDMLHKQGMGSNSLLLLAYAHRSRSLLIDDDATASVGTKTDAYRSIHNIWSTRRVRMFCEATMELSPLAMSQNGFVLRKLILLLCRNVQYRKLFGLKYFWAMRLWCLVSIAINGRVCSICRHIQEFVGLNSLSICVTCVSTLLLAVKVVSLALLHVKVAIWIKFIAKIDLDRLLFAINT